MKFIKIKEIKKKIKGLCTYGCDGCIWWILYICPADKIYAGPQTTTGSIGVIMSNVDYSGLQEKLGVKENVIKSGEHKDIMSSSRK